jgi:hypothetical protein
MNTERFVEIDYTLEIPVENILKDWDVRLLSGAADEGRVELLVGLYQDKKVKDLIEVTPPNSSGFFRMVDGRTRLAALVKLGRKKITVSVLKAAPDNAYIEQAYACNRGPKPPGLEDLKVTVELLMRRGQNKKEIMSGPLATVESSHRLSLACDQVRSNIAKQGVAEAKRILHTLPIADPEARIKAAASRCGVTVAALKKALNNTPGGKKNTLLNEIKKDLGGVNNKRSKWLSDWIVRLEGRHDDGYPTNQVFEVFDYIVKQLQANVRKMEEGRERFERRVNGSPKVNAAGA